MGLKTTAPLFTNFRKNIASFAQEESLSASENIKWRIRNDFRQGKMPMFLQRFYGFERTSDGGFEIVEEEAKIIRYIAKRYGCPLIARELNEMGVKSPSGQEWEHKAVGRMLTNEKYVGDLLLQKSFRENHITKKMLPNTGQLNKYFNL